MFVNDFNEVLFLYLCRFLIGGVGANCIRYLNHAGRGQTQYLISYVRAVWEGAKPNVQSEGERISEDNQQKKR